MKRSEINNLLSEAKVFLKERKFYLPPWAFWSLHDWEKNVDDTGLIKKNMLGWDITDFGSENFLQRGLLLFTLRNGNISKDTKPYAEKIMIVEENQETPFHFHKNKMEDIINRGGGNLIIELFNSQGDQIDPETSVEVEVNGILRTLAPGEKIRLVPGESICLEQHTVHRFYGEPSSGKVLVGEVSSVNDDKTDNYFQEKNGRFPNIDEDEKPLHLLVSDYY